jgi:hypothetical protein
MDDGPKYCSTEWERSASKIQSDTCSGSAVVPVNDAAEDVTTSNGTNVGRGKRAGNRLGPLQPTMWSRFVVVADVRVEHGFEMSL